MKILLFGSTGSIGQRYERLIRAYFGYEVIPFRHKTSYWEDLPGDIDCALICNPTEHHIDTAVNCACDRIPFFLEKPISDALHGVHHLQVMSDGLATYVAYPFRHAPMMQQFRKTMYSDSLVRFVCRSDAGMWPSERRLHGPLLELSHELDLAEYLCGRVVDMQAVKTGEGRVEVVIQHEDHIESTAHLDLHSPVEERYLVIDGHQTDYSASDTLYMTQLSYFFNNLGNVQMLNCLNDAIPLFERIIECQHHLLRY